MRSLGIELLHEGVEAVLLLQAVRRMKAMARQRSHSIEFKRQVAQEFIAGESLYALSKRHDISRQLIRVWVQKYEAGALDEDAQAADLLQEYEAKIAALERMVDAGGSTVTSGAPMTTPAPSKRSWKSSWPTRRWCNSGCRPSSRLYPRARLGWIGCRRAPSWMKSFLT